MINKIKQLLKRRKKFKPYPTQKEYSIEPVFEIGGTVYYQTSDIAKTSCLRGLTAISFYQELQMRCDREYLLAATEAMHNILHNPNGNKIDVFKLDTIVQQLRERLTWAVDIETVYKLASVVYFDDTEDPDYYDAPYNEEKIKKWKEAEGVNAFFLRKPISDLIPFLSLSEIDIASYSQIQEQVKSSFGANIYDMLPSELKTKYTTLVSQSNKADSGQISQ
jgi:hypothetical protein